MPDVALEHAMRDLRSRLLVSHPPEAALHEAHHSPSGDHPHGTALSDAVGSVSPAAVGAAVPRVATRVSLSHESDEGASDVDLRLPRTSSVKGSDYRSDQLVIEKLDVRIIQPPQQVSPRERVRPPAPGRQVGAWSTAARFYISRV
jgi:hypothetical protein